MVLRNLLKRVDRPPAIEHELDPVTFERTGRKRNRQFKPTLWVLAIPPSLRVPQPFE